MSTGAWILIGIAVWLVIVIASAAYREHYGIGKTKIQFLKEETGTTVRVGQGSSLGEAMADGFRKLYVDLSPASRLETIQARYNAMTKTLAENRGRMFSTDIAACEDFIARTRKLLDAKQAEADAKKRERLEKERQAAEKRAEQARRRRQREKEKAEREMNLPEHHRFVSEQRRLVSDSLRYDVLQRDGFRCQLCGATQADGYKLHVDHIRPVSKGGKTEMSNLRTLCERCNMGKRDKIEVLSDTKKTNDDAHKSDSRQTETEAVVRDKMCGCLRHADVIELFWDKNLEYVDKTAQGGGFYFFNEAMVKELKIQKCHVSYAPNGTKSTGGRPAWFVKFQ